MIKRLNLSPKTDLSKLIAELAANPTMGVDLGQNIFKIRLGISGANKGKSGGARVITYVIIVDEVVYLSDMYLKSDYDAIDTKIIIDNLKNSGII